MAIKIKVPKIIKRTVTKVKRIQAKHERAVDRRAEKKLVKEQTKYDREHARTERDKQIAELQRRRYNDRIAVKKAEKLTTLRRHQAGIVTAGDALRNAGTQLKNAGKGVAKGFVAGYKSAPRKRRKS